MRMLYSLKGGVLSVCTTVTAGESVKASGMPFSIGNHVSALVFAQCTPLALCSLRQIFVFLDRMFVLVCFPSRFIIP